MLTIQKTLFDTWKLPKNKVKSKIVEENYWYHEPYFFKDSKLFPLLLKELTPLVSSHANKHRQSCKFSTITSKSIMDEATAPAGYEHVPFHEWETSPTLQFVRQKVETKIGITFDYCLAHIYMNQHANISLHRDHEALDTCIASVSFGEARTFILRESKYNNNNNNNDSDNDNDNEKETKDVKESKQYKYTLNNGDLFIMKEGCQRLYQHTVPPQASAKGIRINLTFRVASY